MISMCVSYVRERRAARSSSIFRWRFESSVEGARGGEGRSYTSPGIRAGLISSPSLSLVLHTSSTCPPSVASRIRGEIGLESPRWLSATFGRHLPAKLIETPHACTCTARTRVAHGSKDDRTKRNNSARNRSSFSLQIAMGESRRREGRREARNT